MRHWSAVFRCIDLSVLDWCLLDMCPRASVGLVGLVVTGVVNLVDHRRVDISGRNSTPRSAGGDNRHRPPAVSSIASISVPSKTPWQPPSSSRCFSHTLRKCERCKESLIVLCLGVARGPILQCPSSTEVSATSLFLCGRDFASVLYSNITLPLSSTGSAVKTRSSNAASPCHFF